MLTFVSKYGDFIARMGLIPRSLLPTFSPMRKRGPFLLTAKRGRLPIRAISRPNGGYPVLFFLAGKRDRFVGVPTNGPLAHQRKSDPFLPAGKKWAACSGEPSVEFISYKVQKIKEEQLELQITHYCSGKNDGSSGVVWNVFDSCLKPYGTYLMFLFEYLSLGWVGELFETVSSFPEAVTQQRLSMLEKIRVKPGESYGISDYRKMILDFLEKKLGQNFLSV